MYKYLCFVSDDAEMEDYYAEILKIKSLYPDCRDDSNAVFDETETGQVFIITDLHGDEARICVKYKPDKKCIVVMSETYLFEYFEDKKVEEGSFGGENGLSKKTETALKIAFIIVNCVASYIASPLMSEPPRSIITIIVLAVIYVISAQFIKKKRNISHFKIMSIQLGGYLMTVIFAVLISLALVNANVSSFIVLFIVIWYFGVVISALAVSGAVNGVILMRTDRLNIKSYFQNKSGMVKKIFSDRITVLSITFFVLNIIISIINYYLPWKFSDDNKTAILSAVLAGIYISSGFLIKKTNDISLPKILFIQFGGYGTSILIIALSFVFFMSFYFDIMTHILYVLPWYFMELLICFCVTVVPAVIASGAVMSVVLWIKNQMKG